MNVEEAVLSFLKNSIVPADPILPRYKSFLKIPHERLGYKAYKGFLKTKIKVSLVQIIIRR
ncbi:MAG: hypothetical protein N2645_13165 [Clostridia bacterium]|nr:hypothetical protein [Clostridia bacterium]